MAEIKIEKKSPIWPWVLLALLIVGVLIYFIFFQGSNGDREQMGETPVATEDTQDRGPINNSTIAAYVNFIQGDTNKMGLDHEFTNEALLRLTNATEALANEVGYDMEKDLQSVREYAQQITQDPFDTSHADNIRSSADILSNVLQNIQQAEFPDLASDASEVKSASESIDPGELTLDQREDVKAFFDKAATLLEKMN